MNIPGWDRMVAGLMSSSVNNGSSTDTGLGRSAFSLVLSRSATCLAIEELGGDVGRADGNSSFPQDSYIKNKKNIAKVRQKHKGRNWGKDKHIWRCLVVVLRRVFQ